MAPVATCVHLLFLVKLEKKNVVTCVQKNCHVVYFLGGLICVQKKSSNRVISFFLQ